MYLGMIILRFLFSCYIGYAGKMLTPAQTHTSSPFPLHLFMGTFPLACPSTPSPAGSITAPVQFELFARPDRTLRKESSLKGGGNSL